ncbi:MAG: gluconate 2-dehydrogenase subunit 3 family protein [Opitutus sp.]|nr:gluconate 2-dehydrogenase subunit 3 family protein [Opitutus sp.]
MVHPTPERNPMDNREKSRRRFLIESAAGLSGAWVAANFAGIFAVADSVFAAAQSGQPISFRFFTPEQAKEIEAMAAQIIPTDDTPGAREAQVIHFIDGALATFDRTHQEQYTKGLADLEARTGRMFPGAIPFSALTSPQQIQVLTAMEKTPFFETVRTHAIIGFFASPVHGGNQGKVGWKLIGYDDSLNFTAPFGYYDSPPLSRSSKVKSTP